MDLYNSAEKLNFKYSVQKVPINHYTMGNQKYCSSDYTMNFILKKLMHIYSVFLVQCEFYELFCKVARFCVWKDDARKTCRHSMQQ